MEDMREESNPDEVQREFAETISGINNGLIILVGLLNAVFLGFALIMLILIYAFCPPNRGSNSPASAVTAKIPLVRDAIHASTKKYDPNDPKMQEGCVICLEDYQENDGKLIAELKCGHIFHEKCL
jgi:hypothetical protein